MPGNDSIEQIATGEYQKDLKNNAMNQHSKETLDNYVSYKKGVEGEKDKELTELKKQKTE